MNILLVEDEPPILRDIEYIIESFHEDYTVYATAANGQDAIDILTENGDAIHLLITDIHIPVIDGLELISYVRQNHPCMECIIITGYSEFEYAKKAISLNVADYLLKPIIEDELKIQLKKIYNKWCMDYLKNEKSFEKKISLNNSQYLYGYCLAIVCLGTFPNYNAPLYTTPQEKWQKCNLDALFTKYSEFIHSYYIIDGASPSEKNLLFTYRKNHMSIQQYTEMLFQDILNQTCFITIAIDTTINGLNNVKKHIDNLRFFLKEHLIIEQSQLLFYEEERKASIPNEYSALSNDLSNLLKLFTNSEIALFDTELQQFLFKMKTLKLPQVYAAKYLYSLMDMCTSQYRQIDSINKIHIDEVINNCIYLSDTYKMIYRNLQSIFHDIFYTVMNETHFINRKQNILLHIDSYIKEHCFEQINTGMIAEKFGFTPAYLSKMFQEYKNISPTDYIIQLRIEKAQELFRCNPQLMIKEVSAYVGYPDSLYFSKVFKKSTGQSPKQFIRSIKNSPDY